MADWEGAVTFTNVDRSYSLQDMIERAMSENRALLELLTQLLNDLWRRNQRCWGLKHTRCGLGPLTVHPRVTSSVAMVTIRVLVAAVVVGHIVVYRGRLCEVRSRMESWCMGILWRWWWLCSVAARSRCSLLLAIDALFEFAICLGVALSVSLVECCTRLRVRSPFGN